MHINFINESGNICETTIEMEIGTNIISKHENIVFLSKSIMENRTVDFNSTAFTLKHINDIGIMPTKIHTGLRPNFSIRYAIGNFSNATVPETRFSFLTFPVA